MTTQLNLTETAHARRFDPQTSHDAARSVTELTMKQKCVLEMFNHGDSYSDEELIAEYKKYASHLPQSESGLRTRRSELVAKGKLIDSGERRKTKSGRNSIVWKLP